LLNWKVITLLPLLPVQDKSQKEKRTDRNKKTFIKRGFGVKDLVIKIFHRFDGLPLNNNNHSENTLRKDDMEVNVIQIYSIKLSKIKLKE